MPANDATNDPPDRTAPSHAGGAPTPGYPPPGTLAQTPTQSAVSAATSGARALPIVPGYEVLGPLGEGGMGLVYRARELAFDRDVAVKLLKSIYPTGSPGARRFLDEARITGQLQTRPFRPFTISAHCPMGGRSWP